MTRLPTRTAIVDFSPECLEELLQLPPGAMIDRVIPHDHLGVLRVRIVGAGFAVSPGSAIPTCTPTVHRLDGGAIRIDWGFPKEDNAS